MATITPVAASTAGVADTYAAASAGGDTIATAGYSNVKFLVRNAGSTMTVTFTGVLACPYTGTVHNSNAITCAVGDTVITIPGFCVAANGNVGVTYSAVTSVTVAAIAG